MLVLVKLKSIGFELYPHLLSILCILGWSLLPAAPIFSIYPLTVLVDHTTSLLKVNTV